jgi:hypothetical protein
MEDSTTITNCKTVARANITFSERLSRVIFSKEASFISEKNNLFFYPQNNPEVVIPSGLHQAVGTVESGDEPELLMDSSRENPI